MCGICGVVGAAPDREMIVRMRDSMPHRGPDDGGLFFDDRCGLGHRRLSIIDLTPAGRQPMSNESGTMHMVMNGEIYNYLELREELKREGHRFISECDAEVIVHLYEKHGEDFPRFLNGIFAIALWDAPSRKLVLARDHLGVKPLYYTVCGGECAFASELRALEARHGGRFALDHRAVADYLLLQYPLGEKTFAEGVRRLLPGHVAVVDAEKGLSISRYWAPPHVDPALTDEASAAEELEALLRAAVKLQLRSDVPVGCHLSGGLDTAVIASLAAPLLPSVRAFTGVFPGGGVYDDRAFASLTANRCGALHHIVEWGHRDFAEYFSRFDRFIEEPMAGPGGIGQFMVAEEAKREVTVLLGGQGADEVFGGYTRYLIYALDERVTGSNRDAFAGGAAQLAGYEPLMRRMASCGSREPWRLYLELVRRDLDFAPEILAEASRRAGGYDAVEEFRASWNRGGAADPLEAMFHFEVSAWLPALLHVEDRTSMAFSLESRVPLLDYRIVELGMRLPPMMRMRGGRLKHIFRRAVREIVPAEILDRSLKIGFPVPSSLWTRSAASEAARGEAASAAPDDRAEWARLSLRRFGVSV